MVLTAQRLVVARHSQSTLIEIMLRSIRSVIVGKHDNCSGLFFHGNCTSMREQSHNMVADMHTVKKLHSEPSVERHFFALPTQNAEELAEMVAAQISQRQND